MAEEKQVHDENRRSQQVRKSVFVLMILSILTMVLTPVVTIYAFRMMTKEVEEPVEETQEAKEIVLPTVQVNIAETNGSRYAQLEIVVEVSDPKMGEYFQEQTETSPDGKLKRIQATIINIVADKRLESLTSTEGKRKLAREIKAALNDLLGEDSGGMVTDVYFCGFLIQ